MVLKNSPGSSHEHLQAYLNSSIKYNDNLTRAAMSYGHAVLAGFQTKDFAQNLTECYDGWINFIVTDIQQLQIALLYADADDAAFNVTKVVGFAAKRMQTCVSFV